MIRIYTIFILFIFVSTAFTQDPKKNPKGFMKGLYEPVTFELSDDVFDKRKVRYDMIFIESSKFKSIRVMVMGSKKIDHLDFLQEEKDEYIKKTFEYGELNHETGEKIKFLKAIKDNAKEKTVHYTLKRNELFYSIIFSARIEVFDKLLNNVEQAVKKIK